MSGFLRYFNLLGVVVVAALCAVQWQANRQMHLDVMAMEKDRADLRDKIGEKDRALAGKAADLEEFRQRVEASHGVLLDLQTKRAAAETGVAELRAERDELKLALDKWTAAVTARDQALKQADAQTQALAAARNEAVSKFNELAGKYNVAVGDLKRAAEQLQALAAERNDAVVKFNDLANKYNALVKGAAASTPATMPAGR